MRIFYEPPNREEVRQLLWTKSPTKTHTVKNRPNAHKSFFISNPMTDPNAALPEMYKKLKIIIVVFHYLLWKNRQTSDAFLS